MKLAKPTEDDFKSVLEFFNACELVLEKAKFSFNSAEEEWEELDEEDEDFILIKKLQKRIAQDEEIDPSEVDNKVLMYDFLTVKFQKACCDWRRVYWAAEVLNDNVCDPTESHLAFHPGLELFHVAPEM